MMDEDCVGFFFGGDGLNSSRNLEIFVSATLFLRANGPDTVGSEGSAEYPVTSVSLVPPCRFIGRGVSSLSVGKDTERLSFRRSVDEALKGLFSVPVRERLTSDSLELSGGLCRLLEYVEDDTSR